MSRVNGTCSWRALGARLYLAYAPLIGLIAGYHLIALMMLHDVRLEISFDLVGIFANLNEMALPLGVMAPFYGYAWLLVTRNGERPVVRVQRWVRRTPFIEITILRLLPMVALLTLLQTDYLAFKRSITDFQPFSWDATFAALDRWLFFGIDAWRVTHALLTSAAASGFLSVAYAFWFFMVFASFAAASMLCLESRLRLTFHLAFILAWTVGGSFLAIEFSSAGPVYFERLFGDPMFAPLMHLLTEQNARSQVYSLAVQQDLWRGYADPAYPAMGISAFPSMHLCSSAVVMLFGFGCNRVFGSVLAAFTAVMLVASVHLGWHYAVDGIAGIVLAVVFWGIAQRFTDWWFDRATERVREPAKAV